MCGVSGIITKNKSLDMSEDLKEMTRLLRHRGPDHTGFFVSKEAGVYLGFNRLSIVDLSKDANQPMLNEDRSIAMVVNGEIYNYPELRKELIAAGHKFISVSDSETILHAYEQWQEDCVTHLRGMFAFAIWDSNLNRLFLARDRIGIKPLYFLNNNSCFCFASELKAFLGLRNHLWYPELNGHVLDMYLNFPFIMDNHATLLKGIQKLPPAHIAVFEEGKLDIRKYWELCRRNTKRISFADALEQTEHGLLDAVKCHFIGDVPIALMLSGGLDSSLIGALALKAGKRIELAITTGHANFALDERKYGKLVARHLGLKHVELEIDPRKVADNIEEYVWYFDDLSIIGFFYQIAMSEMVNKLGYKVILVGQGADEVFGGYHIFKLSTFPFSVLPSRLWNMCYYRMLTNRRFSADYFKYSSLIKKPIFHPGKDTHNICSDFEIGYQLPNYNLTAEDKGFMSHSVESRVPYLDHRLVEYVYNLPQSYKLKGYFFSRKHEVVKYILRLIASKYLPKEIAWRRKQGVGLSIPEVILSNKDKVRESLFASGGIAKRLFAEDKIDLALKNSSRENNNFISRLYILQVWLRKFGVSFRSMDVPYIDDASKTLK